jgi:hypothetical protein
MYVCMYMCACIVLGARGTMSCRRMMIRVCVCMYVCMYMCACITWNDELSTDDD